MKKITFKVNSTQNNSIISLIKEINNISCKIFFDIENGFVTVENIADSMIEDVINLINNHYTIVSVDIDNVEKKKSATENRSTVLEPQTEDDLIIKRIGFQNGYIENRINHLLKTASWALYKHNATEKDIGDYIITCMSEITMRYSPQEIINFSVGDIVDVNYGTHLPGESTGAHIHSIVCNITNSVVYVVPIIKPKPDINSTSYLPMETPRDVIYNNPTYNGGIVLVDKGKYIRKERFNSVVGKTTPEFFKKLLHQLATTFVFTNTGGEVEKSKINVPKINAEEAALLETIGFALDKVDPSKGIEEQAKKFLSDIEMSDNQKMVAQAILVACNIKKINYENVIRELHEKFPQTKEDNIENILKKAFKDWLKKHPTLAKKCPKISIMAVLKVFAKKINS